VSPPSAPLVGPFVAPFSVDFARLHRYNSTENEGEAGTLGW